MWSTLSPAEKAELLRRGGDYGMSNYSLLRDAYDRVFSNGGSIHIDKNKRGTFKAQASRMGMSTQQAASHILANKDRYSPAMVKKAVFAHNFAHANGGYLPSRTQEVNDRLLDFLDFIESVNLPSGYNETRPKYIYSSYI